MHSSLFGLAILLGFRHGLDPDHLAAIDGLARLRNSRWNGVLFGIGHALMVTLLAAGVGRVSIDRLEKLSPFLLIAIGTVNLFRLFRSSGRHGNFRILTSSPLLLGIVFAAGFETASQLSALALVNHKNAWLLGASFGTGMVIVDGIDGYNASNVQRRRHLDSERARLASLSLTILVVIMFYGLGITTLMNIDTSEFSLPIGLVLFLSIVGLRIWSRNAVAKPVDGTANIPF
jgi:nickel/cobalt transporter (NiCoT) family protein